jgi:AraC-like DNA-binding protein
MTIAAFLASDTAAFLRQKLPADEIFFARSWGELDSRIQEPEVSLVLLDPFADGALRIPTVTAIMNRHWAVPVAAYCPLRNENFHTLLGLSRDGLAHVFFHPLLDDGKCLLEMAYRLAGLRLANEFLATMETRLVKLEPRLLCAVMDLFKRPYRYSTGADIGRQSQMPMRHVYRDFDKAQIGTPRKFVAVAKLLRGYSYLSQSRDSVESIGKRLGYDQPRLFSVQIGEVFGCSASKLRKDPHVEEIKTQLLEWLYRPRNGLPLMTARRA